MSTPNPQFGGGMLDQLLGPIFGKKKAPEGETKNVDPKTGKPMDAAALAKANAGANAKPGAKGPGGANPNPGGGDENVEGQEADPNASPLDTYKDLFKLDAENPDEPSGPQPLFKLDMEKFGKQVSSMDFAKSIPKEVREKIKSGDEEALTSALNSVAQQSFAQSLVAASQLMEKALEKKFGDLDSTLEGKFKSLRVSENLRGKNKVFSHSAVSPVVDMIKAQLQSKFPEATSEELSEHAMKYLGGISDMISGKKAAPGAEGEVDEDGNPRGNLADDNRKGGSDFSSFFGLE